KHYFSPDLKGLLLEFMTSPDNEVAEAAADACLKFYPEHLRSDDFIKSGNGYIKKIAVEATGLLPSLESIETLIDAMHDSDIYNESVSALSHIIIKNTELFNETIRRFTAEKDPITKFGLAEVLSYRIEYLLVKLRYDNSPELRKLIIDILARGNITNTITFLNENSDQKLEEMVCGILMEFIAHRVDITREFSLYLNERILAKLNLTKLEPQKGEPRQEVVRIGLLWLFLAIALLFFPAAYAIKYYDTFTHAGITGAIKNFFYLFNYFFAFYGISLNSIYLLLLLFSFIGSRRQLKNWTIKNIKFLFKPGILPSISIIAPAYGEEATIIQSVNSLLNLNYPDYEVIVVNDGSTDSTLRTLIDYFNLERADIHVINKLRTGAIRGLYTNKYLPNLLVVDKVNGGKADSLNAGINMAAKDYFCGIDADSLLERDSLLKMTSPFLDTDTDIIATGGNIVPVNGCTVDKGHLTDIKIPSGFLPRLQTMEYIRSFISGRVGWATIRCLLIISGAFGLFKKSSVIAGGGYLTGKEKFQKDTVGEDMELVVRLIRHSRDRGEKGIVNYVFNANCWTEVPEDYSILRKQRDRWQRGLLDIMTFHIRMLFNPRYREVGLIAFPYFIIFEVIGPWIEAQGLIVFLIALALGLLNADIVLLLFIGTIFMGLAVSIISLYIMERGNNYFPKKDISILILYAFCENFGIRQFFSIQRLIGYINALRNKQGWGRMVRKGFQSKT
ncbi:MAG: glycosyl transferase family 2, partial [Spirochaetae bacterium HGW-Spirochaetae-5]